MKSNAFTMIELIFVIVILSILTAVAIPKLSGMKPPVTITAQPVTTTTPSVPDTTEW